MKTQAQQSAAITARNQVATFEAMLADAIASAPHPDAIAPVIIKAIRAADLSDGELERIGNAIGRIPHDRRRRFPQ